jgi:hypothetical protein
MRIGPRTMLCATAGWQLEVAQESEDRFDELRELCTVAGDKISLAIGMTGLTVELLYAGRSQEGCRLAAEQMELLDSVGDPNSTIGLAVMAFCNWFDAGDFETLLHWSHNVVELAGNDPTRGAAFGIGSPLAAALAWRGVARWWLGRRSWRDDLRDAMTLARNSNPATFAGVVASTYGLEIGYGVVVSDDSAVCAAEEAVQIAEATSNDTVLSLAGYALAVVLLNRHAPTDRARGLQLMEQARDTWRERVRFLVPVTELWISQERSGGGDRDAGIRVMRTAVDEMRRAGRLGYGVWGTGILVETLLERGSKDDVNEAQEAIDWLAGLPAQDGAAIPAITLLRLRTLLARANGDDAAFWESAIRYRELARLLGFKGHIAWAEELTKT